MFFNCSVDKLFAPLEIKMFKPSRTDSLSIYLWLMLCVNISVRNRFDFASRRTHRTKKLVTGLIHGNQSVDRPRPTIIIACVLCHSLSKNSADHMLLNYHSDCCYNHRQKIKIKKHVYKKLARRLTNNSVRMSV